MAQKKSETTAEETQVVKQESPMLPVAMEDFENMSGQGFEEADRDAYAIPFLRILQTNSPQCNPDEESYIEGARPGMFFNTVTGELYGKEVEVIPVHYGRDFIEWLPNRGGFVKGHGPDPSILDKIVKVDDKNNSIMENGNIIQDTRNHYILIADKVSDGPVILSLSSTGIKHSRKWMTLMTNLKIPGSGKTAPMFGGKWVLRSILNENDEGKWYQIGSKSGTAITFSNWVNKEQLDAAVAARDLIMSGTAKADWDSTMDTGGSSTSGEGVPF